MITRRDIVVAVIAAACTGVLVMARQDKKSVMSSRAITWDSLTVEPTKVGERRQVFQDPTPTLDELEIHISTLAPGKSPHAPHQHVHEELLILKEGTLETFQSGKTARVGPGAIIFQSSNEFHNVTNVGTTPATYFVIGWDSPGAKK